MIVDGINKGDASKPGKPETAKPVAEGWKPAKDMAEAGKWAESHGYKLQGFDDVPLANVINEQMEKDFKKHGSFPALLQGKVTIKKANIVGGQIGLRTDGLEILTRSNKSLAEMVKVFEEKKGRNWNLGNGRSGIGGLKHTINHELGHMRGATAFKVESISTSMSDLQALYESKKVVPGDFGGYVGSYSKTWSRAGINKRMVLLDESFAELYAVARAGELDKLSPTLRAFILEHPDVF